MDFNFAVSSTSDQRMRHPDGLGALPINSHLPCHKGKARERAGNLRLQYNTFGVSFNPQHVATMSFRELPLTLWEKVIGLLKGQDRASVRLVCTATREACDSTTKFLTLKRSEWSGFPDMNKMGNCTIVLFLDDTAMLPSFKWENCVQQISGKFLLVCGEWWWRRSDVREWIKYHQNKSDFKVGLLLCIMEQIQGDGDICSTIEEVLDEEAPDLNYLGIWPQLVRIHILKMLESTGTCCPGTCCTSVVVLF